MAPKERKKRISKHYFRIMGHDKLYIKSQILINFSPLRSNKTRKELRDRRIIPTYNDDRKHYTFAFKIPSCFPNDSQDQLRQEHDRRVFESSLQISDIMLPKPKSKHKYCGVCKGHYEEYKDHVEGQQHQQHLAKSIFQAHIRDLCEQHQCKEDERIEQSTQENHEKCIESAEAKKEGPEEIPAGMTV